MEYSTQCSSNQSLPENKNPRKWHDTTLGCKYGSKEYSQRSGDTVITLMSYNILADCLAAMHPELYTHCKDQGQDVLKWEYRFARLMQEIQQHNCDVICLQEVQCDHYETHFKPSLSNLGYNGVFKKRTGDKRDGCAIFFKSGRLELVDTTDVEYYQPKGERPLNRDNIGLLAKFADRNRPEKLLCVATTHLLYNPRRVDVRLAQIAVMLAELDKFCWSGDPRKHYFNFYEFLAQ